MTIQVDDTVANAMLDAFETAIGPSAILEIRTGAPPANPAAANTGTVLATVQLPADWMLAAAARVKQKSGVWEDTAADAAGTAGHYRIKTSGGVPRVQGTVTATGGGGDMTVDNVVFAAGQAFTITGYEINMPNNA